MKVQFNEDYSTVRAMAREALKGKWLTVVLAFMIYNVMTVAIPSLLSVLLPQATISYDAYELAFGVPLSLSAVETLYSLILAGPFSMGLAIYMLRFLRERKANLSALFEGFEFLLKAFALQFMIDLFISLWTMLFIIPGIIAGFRYSQAFFILADDPKKGVMQCIRESKELMYGNKGQLFVLQLTFIGWMILAQIPIQSFFVYNTNITASTSEQIAAVIANIVISIPLFIVNAYMFTSQTFFYEIITGHLVQQKQNGNMNFGGFDDFGSNRPNTGNDFGAEDSNSSMTYIPVIPEENDDAEEEKDFESPSINDACDTSDSDQE